MRGHGLWLVIGAVAGWLAAAVVVGGGYGLITDSVLGVLGAFVGSYLFRAVGWRVPFGLLGTIFVACLGAVLVLLGLRLIARGRRRII